MTEALPLLQNAFAKPGTRLCLIDTIEEVGEIIGLRCRETSGPSGESPGST